MKETLKKIHNWILENINEKILAWFLKIDRYINKSIWYYGDF